MAWNETGLDYAWEARLGELCEEGVAGGTCEAH